MEELKDCIKHTTYILTHTIYTYTHTYTYTDTNCIRVTLQFTKRNKIGIQS